MAKNILLIEDDLDLQRIYSEKLGSIGYNVSLAIDSTQGVSEINNSKPSSCTFRKRFT